MPSPALTSRKPKITEAERALGVRVCIGHDAANVGNADLVVYSAAIHDDNPELQAAQRPRHQSR